MSNNVFYDAKRPAANGRWVAIHRGKVIVEHTSHKTEEEARTAPAPWETRQRRDHQ